MREGLGADETDGRYEDRGAGDKRVKTAFRGEGLDVGDCGLEVLVWSLLPEE